VKIGNKSDQCDTKAPANIDNGEVFSNDSKEEKDVNEDKNGYDDGRNHPNS
jgi:hypothetical protein